ncbi:MAG TPA: dihydroorotate dehydrogenase electron transfer subunit [Kineosporiaceae bacterium]|nr:dihydroorotate dehydrogenase electron transfer subunit [Kineosporiaceae bacterium]
MSEANQPVQVRTAKVVSVTPAGAYAHLVLDAPQIAERARPGQFVALAVGEEPTPTLLRRAFSLHRAGDGRIEIVVAAHGVGSTWVTRRRPGDEVDVVGPLGRPFPAPRERARAVLVGGGYGAAPLPWFAEELLAAGGEVDVVVGAATEVRLFGVAESAKVVGADRVQVTTDDGSAGTRGLVTDALRSLLAAPADPPAEVYACGPMAMLRAVTAVAAEHGAVIWCAVEEAMACGIGVCMTCVLPIRGADGVTRMTRSCTEGPTFAGDTVRWDHVCAGPGGRGSLVPGDCLGAPKPQGGH